jgi:hypothetical protein
MNAIIIEKDTRRIIGYVENVESVEGGNITGKNASVRGVDMDVAEIIVTDYIVENLYDNDGALLEKHLPNDVIDERTTLSFLQKEKIEQLNTLCEQLILAGFRSKTTGHFYAFGERDQLNFTQQMILMVSRSDIQDVVWKTEDAGPVLHSRDEFLAVVAEAEVHKRSKMQRYWELKAQVQAAKTNEEIEAITWEVADGTTTV